MAIQSNTAPSTFEQTFGRRSAANAPTQEREAAQFWLNVGYRTDDPTYPFVSLAQGIPLDTIQALSITGRNEAFREFQSARNDLHAQIMTMAKGLQPGEDRIFETENGLAIQIRRVDAAQEAPSPENNTFVRKLTLA